jgi:hypothetical protein
MGLTTPCLVAGTMVEMRDGGEKPIENIVRGDEVITHRRQIQKVLKTTKTKHEGALCRITSASGRTIIATPAHKFLVIDLHKEKYNYDAVDEKKNADVLDFVFKIDNVDETRVWVEAIKLNGAKHILTGYEKIDGSLTFECIDNIEVISHDEVEGYDGYVYDVVVEDDHSFVAEGINVHNSESCSICGHVTRGSYANRCEHLKFMMNQVLHNGKKVYAVSGTPYKIFDISIISGRQADKIAFSMLTKTANNNGGHNGGL